MTTQDEKPRSSDDLTNASDDLLARKREYAQMHYERASRAGATISAGMYGRQVERIVREQSRRDLAELDASIEGVTPPDQRTRECQHCGTVVLEGTLDDAGWCEACASPLHVQEHPAHEWPHAYTCAVPTCPGYIQANARDFGQQATRDHSRDIAETGTTTYDDPPTYRVRVVVERYMGFDGWEEILGTGDEGSAYSDFRTGLEHRAMEAAGAASIALDEYARWRTAENEKRVRPE